MKTKITLSLMFLGVLLSVRPLSAQTSVSITYAGDSNWATYCHVPAQVFFIVYGAANGYATNDSVSININYGDGTDTTAKTLIQQTWYSGYYYHSYTAPGIYNVQYIATGPDGMADTLVVASEVVIGDSCGNISGRAFVDMNGDCIYNTGDAVMPYFPVELLYNSQVISWTYTDNLGNYYFNAPSGNAYSIRMGVQLSAYGYSVSCPASGQYSVTNLPSPGNDFALTCLSGFDLQGYLWGSGFRPGFTAWIYPEVWNPFCMPVSGQAKLVINDPLLTYVSSTTPPDQIIGDTLIWNFSNLANNNFWYWWYNYLGTVYVHTSVSANIGDTVCATLIITPVAGDVNAANNTFTGCWVVRNSWDPNAKDVSPRGVGAAGAVLPNTEFTYTVEFQNMGTDTAFNIYVLDTLDNDLNISTFHPVASSHPMQADILPGNVLRFNFPNIKLVNSSTNEPMSHGWVTYKVTAKPGLADGTQLTNQAGIYFDFNPAVMTNTTLNTIDGSLGIGNNPSVKGLNLQVYPNPANEAVNIQTASPMHDARLTVYNLLGQGIVSLSGINGNKLVLDSRSFCEGLYFIVINTDNTRLTTKFVIKR